MITDSELQGLAMQALNMAKRDHEQGQFCCVLASYLEGKTIHRMRRIEELLVEKLGQDWLNKGHCKKVAFGLLRMANRKKPVDAVIFVCAANNFKKKEAFMQLNPEQQKTILEAGHDRHHQAVQEGLFEIQDCIQALAQTASRVCMYVQVVDSRHNFEGPSEVKFFDQREFQGPLKLFGESESYMVFSFIRGAALATIVGLVLDLAARGRGWPITILAMCLAAAIGLVLGVASARGKI